MAYSNASLRNLTTPTYNLGLLYHDSLVALLTVNMLCGLIGAAGCILIIAAVLTKTHFQTAKSHVLLVNLYTTDFIISVFSAPIWTVSAYLGSSGQQVPAKTCAWFTFTYQVLVSSGQWTAAALALSRFLAILAPHTFRSLPSKSQWVAVTSAWIIGLLADENQYRYFYIEFGVLPPWNGCGFLTKPPSSGPFVAFLIGIYIPLTLVFVLYLAILAHAMWRWCRSSPTNNAAERQSRMERKHLTLARILFVSSAVYLLCQFPHTLIGTFAWGFYLRNPVALLWIRQLVWVCYAVNPVCVNSTFQDTGSTWLPLFGGCYVRLQLLLQWMFFVLSRDYREHLKTMVKRGWRVEVRPQDISLQCTNARSSPKKSRSVPKIDVKDCPLQQKPETSC